VDYLSLVDGKVGREILELDDASWIKRPRC